MRWPGARLRARRRAWLEGSLWRDDVVWRDEVAERAASDLLLVWDRWLEEEQARQASRQGRTYRPSLRLRADLVARVDRVAEVSGMERAELVECAVEHWLAHWRPCPRVG